MRKTIITGFVMVAASMALAASASAQELRLFGGGHFETAGEPLAKAFSAKSSIETSYTGGNTGNGGMMRRISDGELIDVVVLNSDEMAEEAAAGHIKAGSYATFARDRMGLAVPKGAPTPDISTPDQLREVLLKARAIGMQEPDPLGHSGKNVVEVLTNLGIWDEVKGKIVIYERRIAQALADGTVDIGFWSYPELLRTEEIEVLGPTPLELGGFTDQAIGIPARNHDDASARAFVQYLTSADAEAVYTQYGLDPLAD